MRSGPHPESTVGISILSPLKARRWGGLATGLVAALALAPAAQGQTFDGPNDKGIAGVELTSEHGFYLGMLEAGDTVTLVHESEKTIFAGVKRAGENRIRKCAFMSKWELDKFDVDIQGNTPDNPCTTEDMNELKNRYTFGTDFNGRNRVDGAFVPAEEVDEGLESKKCEDASLYRNYDPSQSSPLNKDPSVKKGFDTPLIVNGQRIKLSGAVRYRWTERLDREAVNVRIEEDSIPGLSDDERFHLNQWFMVKKECLPRGIEETRGGPVKKPGAVRGKRPNLEVRAARDPETGQYSLNYVRKIHSTYFKVKARQLALL